MTQATLLTDQELFQRIADGDEHAFETLFHRYTPRIQPIINNMTGSEAAAKDIIQDIFLNLWITRERLSDIQTPSNWIFRITYNRIYTWLQKRTQQERAAAHIGDRLANEPLPNTTEESLFFAETARLVKQAIRELPPQTQRIYQLSREAGLKNQEVADQLGLSVQTVKNTLSRAAHTIKTYLAEHGVILPVSLILYWLS